MKNLLNGKPISLSQIIIELSYMRGLDTVMAIPTILLLIILLFNDFFVFLLLFHLKIHVKIFNSFDWSPVTNRILLGINHLRVKCVSYTFYSK